MAASDLASSVLPMLVALPVGSFVALLADRLPLGEPVLMGRSRCRSCGAALGWRDLVPVVSFLLLRGRCRHCRAPIPKLLPAAELAALGIALLAWLVLPEDLVWPGTLLGWGLLALALADLRHGVLPDALTLPVAALGFGLAAWTGTDAALDALLGAGLGWASLAATATLYRRCRGVDGMGDGDPILLGAGGAWVGWQGLPPTILLAALTTLLAALIIARGRPSASLSLPFGPGLALGIWLVWLHSSMA